MHRRFALTLLAAAAATPGLAFAEARSVPLKDALHFLDLYLELPPAERSRFYLAYRAVRGGRPAPDARAFIVEPNGARAPLPIDRAGQVMRLPTLAQLKDCELEMVGAPFEFSLEPRAALAPSTQVNPADLAMALGQLNAGIAHSGSLAFLAPKMTVAFFVDAGGGRELLSDGRAAPLPVYVAPAYGATPYFEPAKAAGTRVVQLARAPSRILLGDRPHLV